MSKSTPDPPDACSKERAQTRHTLFSLSWASLSALGPLVIQRSLQLNSTSPRNGTREILFSTGKPGQNLKAQNRTPGAKPEPVRALDDSDVILTLSARVSAQVPQFQLSRNDHSI